MYEFKPSRLLAVAERDLRRFRRNTKLFISELSSSLLIVATVDREIDDAKILDSMGRIVTKTKEELVWLR